METYYKKPEILIVDDSPEQIHIISSILKRENYKVRALINGIEVFDILKVMEVDLILLDIVMPEINGIEICKRIKQDPQYNAIPIIFLTSITDSDTIVDAFSAGAQDYVAKPLNPKELLARVDSHLELKFNTEKLKKAYDDIESFNHMICHDLKSPLLTIKSLIGFLSEEITKENRDEIFLYIQKLNEKAESSILLIDKLSELSKVTSSALTKERFPIRNLFEEVYDSLNNENGKRQIEFLLPELPVVTGDKLLLRQVIFNLLSNAVKYTRNRYCAKIEISFTENVSEYTFCISDNGAGFNMKYADKLFKMFERLHSKNEFEGTGTGLVIARKIIERHDGRIWIQSEEEIGTQVFFTLPI